jgi:hypothetical protein
MNRAVTENKIIDTEHLHPETISIYINLKSTLSKTELSYIENHLLKCKNCAAKFNEIYDEEISLDDRVIFRIVEIDRSFEGGGLKFKDSDFEVIIKQPNESTLKAIPSKLPYAADNQKFKITIEGKEVYWRILNVIEGNSYTIKTKAKNPLAELSNLLVETVFRSNNEIESEVWKKPWFAGAILTVLMIAAFLYFFVLN